MAYSKRMERWADFCACAVWSLSVRATAQELGIHKDTAWRWRHRLLRALLAADHLRLAGIVEMEPAFFIYSEKGRRRLRRPPRRRGSSSGVTFVPDLAAVLVARARNGTVVARVTGRRPPHHSALSQLLSRHWGNVETVLTSMTWRHTLEIFCRAAGVQFKIMRSRVSVGKDGGLLHMANVRGYIVRFRRWLVRFRGVATKYLDHYLCWHRFLEARAQGAGAGLLLQSVRFDAV